MDSLCRVGVVAHATANGPHGAASELPPFSGRGIETELNKMAGSLPRPAAYPPEPSTCQAGRLEIEGSEQPRREAARFLLSMVGPIRPVRDGGGLRGP